MVKANINWHIPIWYQLFAAIMFHYWICWYVILYLSRDKRAGESELPFFNFIEITKDLSSKNKETENLFYQLISSSY